VLSASPVITEQPESVFACENGDLVGFYVSASASGEKTYEWFHDGEPIEDSDSFRLRFVMEESSVGYYYVQVTADGETVTSEVAELSYSDFSYYDVLDVSEEDRDKLNIQIYHYHNELGESWSDCGSVVVDETLVGGTGIQLSYYEYNFMDEYIEDFTSVEVKVIGPCILEVDPDYCRFSSPDSEIIRYRTAVAVPHPGPATVRIGSNLYGCIMNSCAGSMILDSIDYTLEPRWDMDGLGVNDTLYVGSEWSFSVQAVSAVGGIYELWHNGEKVMESDDGSFTLEKVTLEDDGDYEVYFSDAYGSLEPFVVSLTVKEDFEAAMEVSYSWRPVNVYISNSLNSQAGWSVVTDGAMDGVDAVYGSCEEATDTRYFEFSCVVPSRFSFWWKKTGEGSLSLSTEETVIAEYLGDGDWEQVDLLLPALEEGFRRYYYITLSGVGEVWLDQSSYERFNDFELWMADYLGSLEAMVDKGDALYELDPDKDGLSHAMEFLFETDPTVASLSPMIEYIETVDGERFLTIEALMKPYSEGYYLEFQGSNNMKDWEYISSSVSELGWTSDMQIVKFVDQVALSENSSRFVRLVMRERSE